MKHFKATLLILIFTFTATAQAEKFSSFSSNQFVIAEGRWFIVGDKFIYKINEGTGNEETLYFEANSLQLINKVKYKLCIKIKKECTLQCSGELVKNLATLNPWEEAAVLPMNAKGAYPGFSEAACKGARE